MQHGRIEHEAFVCLVQWLQRRTTRAGPGRQRRARRVHARARVDGLLPVVRQMVGEAADQRVCHQAAGGDAAVDHVGLGRLLHQLLAAPASPLAVDVAVHEELRRDDVQPLADVLAHALHRRTAVRVRAGGVVRLVAVLHALQVFGQRLAARPAGGILGCRRHLGQPGLQGCQLRLQIGLVLGQRLGEQRALLRRHRLGLGAALPALQARQFDVDLLQPRIAPGDLAVLAFDLSTLARDVVVLARDLVRLLLDALAHAFEHGLHRRGQCVFVDVAQTKHVRHRAASATPAPLAQAPLPTRR